MVTLLLVPSLETEKPMADQFVVPMFGFCCNVQPAEGYGHKTLIVVELIT